MTDALSKLKKKAVFADVKALAVTITIHALLILFAGSIVAVRYLGKQSAEFTVTTGEPRLERRQLELPSKLEKVQETSRQPTLVSRQVSTATPVFTAPEMGTAAKISTQRSTLPGSGSGPDFSAIPRGFGTTPPQIRFFGIRVQGEKIVFLIDVSEKMLHESSGGRVAAEFIKESLYQTLDQMTSSVLFNVILHDGDRVLPFRERMVPATSAHRSALRDWLAPVNLDPEQPAGLREEQDLYAPQIIYETAVGQDASGWMRSLQLAMEQRADTLFIVGPDWGRHRISPMKRQLMLDFSLWELLSGGGQASVAGSPILHDERRLRNELIRQAVDSILREDRGRSRSRSEFVRDILMYVEYTERQLLDHVDTVYQTGYVPLNLARPQIHFVRQIPGRSPSIADTDTTRIRNLVRNYSGELAFFRGQEAVERARLAGAIERSPAIQDSVEVPEETLSDVRLFGARARGSRLAFILDAGKDMLKQETGSTGSFAFIKDQLLKTVAAIDPKTQFNVIVFDEEKTALFQPDMIPAARADALAEWLADLNRERTAPGVQTEEHLYIATAYETAVGDDATSRLAALQAAMELRADCILLISTGTGHHPVRRDKARRLIDFSVWNALGASVSVDISSMTTSMAADETTDTGGDLDTGGELLDTGTGEESAPAVVRQATGTVTGGLLSQLEADRRQQEALIRQALQRIAREKEDRRRQGLPAGFIPDVLRYIGYLPDQIIAHLDAVAQVNYRAKGLGVPKIHFINLMERNARLERDTERALKALVDPYGGDIRLLRGAHTEEEMRRQNRLLELHP